MPMPPHQSSPLSRSNPPAAQNQEQGQRNSYETVRAWYLARLRKRAVVTSSQLRLTPAALISADRRIIEKLIAERARLAEQASNRVPLFALNLWLGGTLLAFIALLIAAHGNATAALATLFKASIGLIFTHTPDRQSQFTSLWPIPFFYYGLPLWWSLVRPLDKHLARRFSK